MPSSHHQQLMQRLRDRTAVIGIAELGYAGLPLAICFREAGYCVVGFDNDPDKVANLNSGRSYSVVSFDCAVVATNHDRFDYELIGHRAQLIVDTRGVYTGSAANIAKA